MANYISKNALKTTLEYVTTKCTHIHLVESEVTAYADLAAATLGKISKTNLTITETADAWKLNFPEARITASRTSEVKYIAFVDETNNEILVSLEIFIPQNAEDGVDVIVAPGSIQMLGLE